MRIAQVSPLYEVMRDAASSDVIHFHVDYLHFPLSRRAEVPHVTTLHGVGSLSRRECRAVFARRFTAERMARDYLQVYERLAAGARRGEQRVEEAPTQVA